MTDIWTWRDRARRLRLVLVVCWLLYVVVSVILIFATVPPVVANYPPMFAVILAMYVCPAIWIHVLWAFNPGYLFMSNGIRRIRSSGLVEAQTSLTKNRNNEYGVPPLQDDLSTPIRSELASASPAAREVVRVQVVWDDYLFAASRALSSELAVPRRTMRAALRVEGSRLALEAGAWRPGAVFDLPITSIVGVWNGSEVATIGSGRVLVVVVAKGEDRLLFPLEIVRWPDRPKGVPAVEAMRDVIEARRAIESVW